MKKIWLRVVNIKICLWKKIEGNESVAAAAKRAHSNPPVKEKFLIFLCSIRILMNFWIFTTRTCNFCVYCTNIFREWNWHWHLLDSVVYLYLFILFSYFLFETHEQVEWMQHKWKTFSGYVFLSMKMLIECVYQFVHFKKKMIKFQKFLRLLFKRSKHNLIQQIESN